MTDKYAADRYEPASKGLQPFPHLKLIFDGSQLRFDLGGSEHYTYPAVSGNSGHEKIPEGKYWINPHELEEFDNFARSTFYFWQRFVKEGDSASEAAKWVNKQVDSWGKWRILIHPYTDTETGGRGGFFIHGGAEWGSAGCIDLAWYMGNFVTHLVSHAQPLRGYIDLEVAYS